MQLEYAPVIIGGSSIEGIAVLIRLYIMEFLLFIQQAEGTENRHFMRSSEQERDSVYLSSKNGQLRNHLNYLFRRNFVYLDNIKIDLVDDTIWRYSTKTTIGEETIVYGST